MNRQQQLQFCKSCLKRKFDPRKGIICTLTNDIANFDNTCADYERDTLVYIEQSQENSVEKKKEKKKKNKRKKIPEVLTLNDFFLILGFVFSTLFVIRLFNYFSLGYNSARNFLLYIVLTLISISIALLLRDKSEKNYRFFGDFKFKVAYTIIFTSLHILYILFIKTVEQYQFGQLVLINLFIVFALSMLSYIIVKPIYFFRTRKSKRNEKIA